MDWSIVRWMKDVSKKEPRWPNGLPVNMAKGLLHPEDVRKALDAGCDGVVISNHGGRQLDSAPAAIEVLGECVAEARKWEQEEEGRKSVEVWLDSGIRRGSDVFKSIALGADGCLLGRPMVFALACGGQTGVSRMLQILKAELQCCMRLAGCRTLEEISKLGVRCGNAK